MLTSNKLPDQTSSIVGPTPVTAAMRSLAHPNILHRTWLGTTTSTTTAIGTMNPNMVTFGFLTSTQAGRLIAKATGTGSIHGVTPGSMILLGAMLPSTTADG